VDGGPLWYEMYLNYALLCILIYFSTRKILLSTKKIFALLSGALILIYGTLFLLQSILNGGIQMNVFQNRPIVEYALFLTGSGLILLILDRKKYPVLILICFIAGFYFHTYTPVISYLRYYRKTVLPSDRVMVVSSKPMNTLALIAQEGQLFLYRYDATRQEPVLSVASRYSHLFYRDIAVEGKTCDPVKTISQSTTLSVHGGNIKNLAEKPSPFFLSFQLEPLPNQDKTYSMRYTYSDCLQEPNIALVNHLREMGFASFVMYQ
jgi:hypothetical protein